MVHKFADFKKDLDMQEKMNERFLKDLGVIDVGIIGQTGIMAEDFTVPEFIDPTKVTRFKRMEKIL